MAEAGMAGQQDRALIQRCLAGETGAITEFQAEYGELIYGFPIRVYHVPRDSAGDFYIFAFEKGRIFRRVQTFEGRIALRAYLLGFVLDNLVLEWKRGEKEIETVPIEAVSELADDRPPLDAMAEPNDARRQAFADILAEMPPAKSVVLKLLHIEDCDLSPEDIRYLRKVSGRRVPDILAEIERMRSTVREREAGLKRVEDQLEGVHAWIQLYERRLRRIATDLAALPPAASTAESLRSEQLELERKLQWRQKQRANLLDRAQRRKVTTPYKDIAALLNTTVGNIASQILRVRKDVAARAGGADFLDPSGDSDV
jgi:RNA polymerase sigma factor (sigma-70 family)